MADRPSIVVLGFDTTYETKNGSAREIEWVTYAPAHMAMYSQIRERVSFMRPKGAYANDDEGKKSDFMRWRWEMIEPAYQAWKNGQDIPVDGTPLAAWSGVNAAQAKVLATAGIKTVEMIATMPDSALSRVQLPSMRQMRDLARTYLETADRQGTASRLADLEAQLAAAMALLEEQVEKSKPKRGKQAAVEVEDA